MTAGTVTESGFEYGLSSDALTDKVTISNPTATFSTTIPNLSADKVYYYRSYVTVKGTGTFESTKTTFRGEIRRFNFGTKIPAKLEAPATTDGYIHNGLGSGPTRNYNYCFDKSHYASLWVAYPLTEAHTKGNASNSNWKYDPNIGKEYQPAITNNSYGTVYGNTSYSRGHQCPDASRVSDATMNSQTYYATNQTPQLQIKFNSGIWNKLEGDVRLLTTSTDTVYVVTGPCYQTVRGSEEVMYLNASNSTTVPSSVPVPNYYWKALLKIKTVDNCIVDACAVGIWLKHEAYEDSDYTKHLVSIDEIEARTGFDLFASLLASLQSIVESETPTWSDFNAW